MAEHIVYSTAARNHISSTKGHEQWLAVRLSRLSYPSTAPTAVAAVITTLSCPLVTGLAVNTVLARPKLSVTPNPRRNLTTAHIRE